MKNFYNDTEQNIFYMTVNCKLWTAMSVIDKEIMVIIMGCSLMEDVLIYKECLLMDSVSCNIITNNKIAL